MQSDAVDIHVPEGMTDEDALAMLAAAIGADIALQKALKHPAPTIERARARKAFLSLQRAFRDAVTSVYEEMDDVAQTTRVIQAESGEPGPASEAAQGLFHRTHQRCIALFNAQFRMAYGTSFELGLRAGGATRGMTNIEAAMVRKQRLNENAFAGNFLTDVAQREGTMSYARRVELYGNALEEMYWQGYLYADLSADRYLQWVMPYGSGFGGDAKTEHCLDCARLAGNLETLSEYGIKPAEARKLRAGGRWGTGVYQAIELAQMAIAPQSGRLSCTTHCHCFLRPAQRPEAKPAGKVLKRFRSLQPKHFTGTGRNKRGGVVVEREHKQARRKRYAQKARRTEHQHVGRRR